MSSAHKFLLLLHYCHNGYKLPSSTEGHVDHGVELALFRKDLERQSPCCGTVGRLLWHGLPTVPLSPTVGLRAAGPSAGRPSVKVVARSGDRATTLVLCDSAVEKWKFLYYIHKLRY